MITIDLSNPENFDWKHNQSEDIFQQMSDAEQHNRSFKILLMTIQTQLDNRDQLHSLTEIARWLNTLSKEQIRTARKHALKTDSESDYTTKVANELIRLYFPTNQT